jgi:uncharacterized protein YggE
MKQTATLIVFFFLALFAYTRLAGPIPFSITSVTTQKTDSFTVTGEGKVFIKPDVARTTVGVQVNGATVKQVQQELNNKINQVSAAVKKTGVADKDIQTTNYWISPTYDYTAGSQRITGYSASTQLTIKAREIDKINEVIDAATDAGANTVGGVSFDVDDKTKAENEARTKAVAEAKAKAENAARAAGFQLGSIVNYSEGFGGYPGPIPMMAKAEGMAVDRAPTQVEPGSSEIVVTVSLSYEIRP